jgi:hypothetical protein
MHILNMRDVDFESALRIYFILIKINALLPQRVKSSLLVKVLFILMKFYIYIEREGWEV